MLMRTLVFLAGEYIFSAIPDCGVPTNKLSTGCNIEVPVVAVESIIMGKTFPPNSFTSSILEVLKFLR